MNEHNRTRGMETRNRVTGSRREAVGDIAGKKGKHLVKEQVQIPTDMDKRLGLTVVAGRGWWLGHRRAMGEHRVNCNRTTIKNEVYSR